MALASPQRGPCGTFLKIEPLLLTLNFLLFPLLILDIFPDRFLINTYCADKIATGSKMIPPIGLPFQLRVALENLDRDLSLQGPHQLGYRNLWRNGNQKVDVIILDIELIDDTSKTLAKHLYIVINQFFYRTF